MKTNLQNIIKTLGFAALLVASVSVVHAFQSATPTATTINPPITTGSDDQTKTGGIFSEKLLVSKTSFFTQSFLPGNESWMRIGSAGGTNVDLGTALANQGTVPLTIDLTGRANRNSGTVNGQDAIDFISGAGQCADKTTFVNDKAAAFEFAGPTATGNADLIARQVQLTGGAPSANSVLASDANGNAVWAHLVVQNGTLKVINNATGNPVVDDANCLPPTNPNTPQTL